MASQNGTAPSGPKKQRSRVRGKQKRQNDAIAASGLDLDVLVMGAAPVTATQDRVVTTSAPEVVQVKKRKTQQTPKWLQSRRVGHADTRHPQLWIIKEPTHSRPPTCMECLQDIRGGRSVSCAKVIRRLAAAGCTAVASREASALRIAWSLLEWNPLGLVPFSRNTKACAKPALTPRPLRLPARRP